MGSFRQVSAVLVCEGKSALYRLQLTDEDDADLPRANLASLTLTLYCGSKGEHLGEIINDRDQVDILDAAGGEVSSSGLMAFSFSPEDNQLLSQRRGFETHVALFEWESSQGHKGAKELSFTVANQSKLPHAS